MSPRSFAGWSDLYLRRERLGAQGDESIEMDAEIERRKLAQQKREEMSRRIRELRAAAVAAGDWNRVQLCDVAAHGVASSDERLEIDGRRYSMDEARREIGLESS